MKNYSDNKSEDRKLTGLYRKQEISEDIIGHDVSGTESVKLGWEDFLQRDCDIMSKYSGSFDYILKHTIFPFIRTLIQEEREKAVDETKGNIEKIALELADNHYPDDTKDWTLRHKFLALVGEIISKL